MCASNIYKYSFRRIKDWRNCDVKQFIIDFKITLGHVTIVKYHFGNQGRECTVPVLIGQYIE